MFRGGSAMVYVSEMGRSVEFYERGLGLKMQFRAGDEYAALDAGEGFIVALHPKEAKSPKPGTAGATLLVLAAAQPLEKIRETLRKRGVKCDEPIVEDPPVRIMYVKDPDGTPISIVEMVG